MTSLDDLRTTLERHADGVVDHALPVRAPSVHTRVRVIRRRRRVAASAGVAAVLAVVAGVGLLPHGADRTGPEPTTVVGIDVPSQMEALGFHYLLSETHDGEDGRVRLELPDSDLPRLVSWATSGDDDTVTLDGPGFERALTYGGPDFGDWYWVPGGSGETITVTAESGDPGVAVYTLGGERPEGVTQGITTFRQSAAGYELLGAVFGEPGESAVDVSATAPSRGVALRYYCTGGPKNAWLHLDSGDGELVSGEGCDRTVPADPVSGGGSEFESTPGEDVSTHFYVTEGEHGPVVDDPDLRLTLGLYARTDDRPGASAAGDFPQRVEDYGHTWRRVSLDDAVGQESTSRVAPAADGPVLVRTYVSARGGGYLQQTVDGVPGTVGYSAGTGSYGSELVDPGSTVALERTNGQVDERDAMTIAFYVRAD